MISDCHIQDTLMYMDTIHKHTHRHTYTRAHRHTHAHTHGCWHGPFHSHPVPWAVYSQGENGVYWYIVLCGSLDVMVADSRDETKVGAVSTGRVRSTTLV